MPNSHLALRGPDDFPWGEQFGPHSQPCKGKMPPQAAVGQWAAVSTPSRGCGGTWKQERSWPSAISPPKQEGKQQSRSARGHQDTILQGGGFWQE